MIMKTSNLNISWNNIDRGLCGTLSRDEEDDDKEYVSGSPSNSDADCNGDCGEKKQDMQSVNLIRPESMQCSFKWIQIEQFWLQQL